MSCAPQRSMSGVSGAQGFIDPRHRRSVKNTASAGIITARSSPVLQDFSDHSLSEFCSVSCSAVRVAYLSVSAHDSHAVAQISFQHVHIQMWCVNKLSFFVELFLWYYVMLPKLYRSIFTVNFEFNDKFDSVKLINKILLWYFLTTLGIMLLIECLKMFLIFYSWRIQIGVKHVSFIGLFHVNKRIIIKE